MNEIPLLLAAWLAGCAIGGIFFGGLWWTIGKGISSKQPGLWFFASLLLRLSIVLGGFYFVGRAHWQRMLLCLLGCVMARLAVMWVTRPPATQEASHAP